MNIPPVAGTPTQKRLQQCWQQTMQGRTGLIFAAGRDSEQVCRMIDLWIATEGVVAFRWQMQERDTCQPFSPLLPLISQILKQRQLPAEQLLDGIGVRSQYRTILLHYFANKPLSRVELPLPGELVYERNFAVKLMVDMLNWLAVQQPLCLLASNLEFAGPSALKVLQTLADQSANIMVVAGLDTEFIHSDERIQDAWQGFLDWLEREQGVLRLPADEPLALSQQWPESPYIMAKDPRAVLRDCEALLALMCLPEANYASEQAERGFVVKGLSHDTSSRLHLQAFKGHCLLYLGELDEAFDALDSILEQAQLGTDRRAMARAYRHLCWAYIYKSDLTQALSCGRQAVNYALGLADEKERACCLFNYFVACDRANAGFGVERFAEMLQLLQQLNMDNALIYAYRSVYGQLEHIPQLTEQRALEAAKEAIKLARQADQQAGLAAAYHSRAVVLESMQLNHQAKRCFAISEKLRSRLQDPVEIARVRNGFGYFYCQQEQFLEAYDYFNGALKQVIKANDVGETIATLYNLAWLYLVVRHYRHSATVLEKLRRLMVSQHSSYFAFRNLHDVHLMQGVVLAFGGEFLRAQQCLERSKRLSIPLSQSALILRPMLTMLLQCQQAPEQQFSDEIERISQRLKTSARLRNQFDLLWLEVQLRCAKVQQQNEHAEQLLAGAERCRAVASAGWQACRQWLHGNEPILVSLPLPSMELEHLFVLAQQEARLNQLWKRMREVRLISALQAIGSEANNEAKVAKETVRLLCGHYDFQIAMVIDCQTDTADVMAVHVDGQVNNFPVDELAEDVRDYRNEQLLLNRSWLFSGGSKRLSSVCVLPLRDGNLRCCQLVLVNIDQPYSPSKHDREVLSLIGNQLASQLVAIRQRNKLIELSSIDTLTGLANRQSLQTTIQDEISRVRRYSGQVGHMSLAFLDLDNFKYYNDTFGHDAGDLLLQWFADLLLEQLRDVDVAARWGGDEFIVFMPETGADQAHHVGDRILQALSSKRGFTEQLSNKLKRAVAIPQERWLSCSVGVTETDYLKQTPDAAGMLTEADKALYQAKENGKGRVIRYRNPA
ncbi:diguanylate cyclase [Neiella marina]|uniref:diguanylate cyclase n=1 Tax=Neiella holothuriorum TaxID=2870530 RepID=A0ABS7EIV5_9GAMM|nr:diguanylate cyclase [Neiella holothuriorum]MBW8192274.1 diguanylate cyclase [Neiella holothuriorum]